jgi:hypothetical protein
MSHTLLQTVYQLTAKVPEMGAPMQDPGSDLFDAVHRKLPSIVYGKVREPRSLGGHVAWCQD